MGAPGTTPGGWHARAARDYSGDIGIASPVGLVAECFAAIRTHDERSAEVEANAHQIAASPALYDALALASDALSNAAENGFYIGEGVFKKIHAALRLARGEGA